MPVVLYFCDTQGGFRVSRVEYCSNACMVKTNAADRQADLLVGSMESSLVSGTGDGEVTIDAQYGGVCGDSLKFAQEENASGNADEPLTVLVSDLDITVAFATDGGGTSITPTSQQVADLVNADIEAAARVVATAGGSGAGLVVSFSLTALSGGLDDGDRHRATDGNLDLICTAEVS